MEKMNQIPKVIHLFWFGRGEKSDVIKDCIASWHQYAPDYEIIEWNEDNFDVNFCERSRQAYEQKKWAFVADIARLKVIYEQGGIYLDTDVLMKQPFQNFVNETKEAPAFFLFHNERFIGTGYGFGAVAGSEVIGYLLNNYERMNFELKRGIFAQVCTQIETEALEDYSAKFRRNNKTQTLEDGTLILSTGIWTQYLDHLGTGTWVEGGRDFEGGVKHRKLSGFKKFLRKPAFFRFVRKCFGRKAEYVYEFLTYDLLDMGFTYFAKRLFKKLVRR